MATKVKNAVAYAIGRWVSLDRPRYENSRCMASKRGYEACNACADVCPTGATQSYRRHDWAKCIDCGLCASVCPTRAIKYSANRIDDFLNMAAAGLDETVLTCEANERSGRLRLYCLGGIPWEALALAALDGHIVIDLSACKGCPETQGRKALLDNLEMCAGFLGAKFFKGHVSLDGPAFEGGLARRDAFAVFQTLAGNVTNNLLHRNLGEPIDTDFFKKALKDRLEAPKEGDPKRYGLVAPKFTENCWGCTLCKNTCPTKAISLGGGEDAQECVLEVDAMLCTGCGLCASACKDGGIESLMRFRTEAPLVRLATPAHPSVCTRCGRNFRPNGKELCGFCIKAAERDARLQGAHSQLNPSETSV